MPVAKKVLLFWSGSSVLGFFLMISSFWLYVNAERAVEQTAEQRFNAVVAAENMRHTSESLTKLVRSYISTGGDQYKTWYNELEAVRQGTSNAPANQYIWDLHVYGEKSPMDFSGTAVMSLRNYLESVAKGDEYGHYLRDSWLHTHALSIIERTAINLYDTANAENKKKARDLLFSPEYNDAKLEVIRPLMLFQNASTVRNMRATEKAKNWATATRITFLLLGFLSVLLAWRTYQSVKSVHGASVLELQEQIKRMGQGDFAKIAVESNTRNAEPNSLMSSLNHTRVRLQELDAARQSAEYELSDKNRDLALNNLVLQELTEGFTLEQLLERLIRNIEQTHSGLFCAVFLADKDGLTLRHAAAPSLGSAWANAMSAIDVGPSAGSCGTSAHRRKRVLVEDVLSNSLWFHLKEAALEAGIRSSWCQPIFDAHEMLIGTFSIYQKCPALPTEQELRWMESFAKLAGYIIERSRLATALNQTRYLYDLIAKNINDLIWVQDLPSMRLRYLSPSSSKVLGWDPEEFTIEPMLAFSTQVQADLFERFMSIYTRTKAGDASAMEMTFDSELQTKSRGLVPVEVSVRATLDENGQPSTLIGIARDITERRKAEETIRDMAFYDALTRLPNRRLLEDRLHQVLALAKRNKTKVSVLFIDLDRFKAVNDQHGHKMGDWLLVQVAKRMNSVLRDTDTAARVGGDEFVVLLPGSTSMEAAVVVAHKIRAQMAQPFITQNNVHLSISCSVGVAMYPDQANNPRDLLHFGDEAMYQAKKDGRNAVVAFDNEWTSTNLDALRSQNPADAS